MIQQDGRILAIGTSDRADFALARYNSNGSLDSTFDSDGKVVTDFGSFDYAESVAIQTDGMIIVGGTAGFSSAAARYQTDGSLDLGFGTNGIVRTNFNNTGGGFPPWGEVATQADGKILIAGSLFSSAENIDFALARYLAQDDDSPVAAGDELVTSEDVPLTLGDNVLSNDTVTAGRTLSVGSVSVIPGTTVGSVNGTSYTPPKDFFGTDYITYAARDSSGLLSNVATVTIQVNPVNDPPTAPSISFVVDKDSVSITLDILTSPGVGPGPNEAETLVVSAVGDLGTNLGTKGTVTIASDGASVLYTPQSGFIGNDHFSYTLTDAGGLTATGIAGVSVRPDILPGAVDDYAYGQEGQNSNATFAVLENDFVNASSNPFLVSVTDGTYGSVSVNGDLLVYSPHDPDFYGFDSYTYVMNDTSGLGPDSTATVHVEIEDVNDPPELGNDTVSTSENTPVTIPISTLLSNDSPGSGEAPGIAQFPQTLTITSVSASPGNGTVIIDGESIVFTPPGPVGEAFFFSYEVIDSGVPAMSNTAFVTVTVDAVNDPPIANPDSVSTDEDEPLSILTSTLLANDSPGPADEAGQTLSITGVSAQSLDGGTASLSGGNVSYTPASNYFGSDTFTYTLADSAGGVSVGTVSVTVGPINDLPIAGTDSATAITNATTTIALVDLLQNDSPGPANESAQTLSITAVSATPNTHGTVALNGTSSISYTPIAGYSGAASFQYTLQDSGPSGGANINQSKGVVDVTVVSAGLPDLSSTSFSVGESHVLKGQTSISFTIENSGAGPSGSFDVQVVWSNDSIIGNEDDIVVATESFSALAAGASESRSSLAIQLDRAELFRRAKEETPPNLGTNFQSRAMESLGIVIDSDNSIEESDETNNFNQGLGDDSANITYFPWDINRSGQITPTDVIYILNRLGDSDQLADLDGSGLVTPTEAVSAINRLGYLKNDLAAIFASISKFIVAADGGTIALDNGSEVIIPAGLLAEDQQITLSQALGTSEMTPTGLLQREGDGLVLEFSKKLILGSGSGTSSVEGENSAAIGFNINYGSTLPSRVSGSVPLAARVLDGRTDFFGAMGELHTESNSFDISIDPSFLSGSESLALSAANTVVKNDSPPELGAREWDGSKWIPYVPSATTNEKTLVLVHGIFSSVESAFPSVNAIRDAGGYQRVIGYNYAWRQDINQSGEELAGFLDSLSNAGTTSLDIEAHSQGVPVTIAAMARTTESMRIPNFVSNGGPLNGTPAANLPENLVSVLSYANPAWNLANLAIDTIFSDIDGLKPNNADLIANRRAAQLKHPESKLIPVVATDPWDFMPSFTKSFIGCQSQFFDGIICGESADGSQSDWINRSEPIVLQGKNHNEITGNPEKIEQVGKQVSAGILVTPTSGLETSEDGGTATFTIELTSDPETVVTIKLRSDNENEGTISPKSAIFASDNWSDPIEITVTGIDDNLLDGDTSYKIVTEPAESINQDSPYRELDAADVTIVNIDNENDAPGITVSATSGLETTEDGGIAKFTIVLDSDPGSFVGIDLRSSNVLEGNVSPQLVLFDSEDPNLRR